MTALYCVGCGNLLVHDAPPGKVLAISCGGCEAMAPILVRDLQDAAAILQGNGAAIPLSAIRLFSGALEGREPPHWQYYLGFVTDFTCPARKMAMKMLKLKGCTSALECQDERCRRQVPRLVESLKERQERSERWKREAEIGEA